MDSLTFRDAIANAKPPIEALVNAGLSRDEAFELAASFEITVRSTIQHCDIPDLALNELYSKSDVSRAEIGMVRFVESPEEVSRGWIVGRVEADYLMLDRKSGEVLVIDIRSLDHVIWRCAKDGESFLAAIAVVANYLGSCICLDQSGSSFQEDTLRNCETLAGGSAYLAFYKMLIGF